MFRRCWALIPTSQATILGIVVVAAGSVAQEHRKPAERSNVVGNQQIPKDAYRAIREFDESASCHTIELNSRATMGNHYFIIAPKPVVSVDTTETRYKYDAGKRRGVLTITVHWPDGLAKDRPALEKKYKPQGIVLNLNRVSAKRPSLYIAINGHKSFLRLDDLSARQTLSLICDESGGLDPTALANMEQAKTIKCVFTYNVDVGGAELPVVVESTPFARIGLHTVFVKDDE